MRPRDFYRIWNKKERWNIFRIIQKLRTKIKITRSNYFSLNSKSYIFFVENKNRKILIVFYWNNFLQIDILKNENILQYCTVNSRPTLTTKFSRTISLYFRLHIANLKIVKLLYVLYIENDRTHADSRIFYLKNEKWRPEV